jgi:hypothetical protein
METGIVIAVTESAMFSRAEWPGAGLNPDARLAVTFEPLGSYASKIMIAGN